MKANGKVHTGQVDQPVGIQFRGGGGDLSSFRNISEQGEGVAVARTQPVNERN